MNQCANCGAVIWRRLDPLLGRIDVCDDCLTPATLGNDHWLGGPAAGDAEQNEPAEVVW